MRTKNKVFLALAVAITLFTGGFILLEFLKTPEPQQSDRVVRHDDFSSYTQGATFTDGATFGEWSIPFAGYGNAKITDDANGGNALEMAPMVNSGPTDTSSIMALGVNVADTFTYSGKISTLKQLRQGATPNPWETAWIVWNHIDNDHYYYFVARADGWELGKRDPKYFNGQRFIASGNENWPLNSIKDFKISKTNNVIQIDINNQNIVTVKDNENPYNSGKIGVYSEDARVFVDDILVDDTATITTAIDNGGISSIEGTPKVNETLTAKISDADGVDQITSYQWMRAGQNITGATNNTYTPTAIDQGRAITVRVTYIDGNHKLDSQISTPVVITDQGIQAPNNPGMISIEGETKINSTLTAKVIDNDGVPERIQYTWLADNQIILGNTTKNLVLDSSYLNKKIQVKAFYHDNAAHEENVSSAEVGPITNPAILNIPAETTGKNQLDNFENYNTSSSFTDGQKFADWELIYGRANIQEANSNKTLSLSSIVGQDSASLMLGKTLDGNFKYSGDINSLTQLAATPQPWQTEWIIWNYIDHSHFYYLAPRENGWVFAKRNGDVNNPEILASGNETFPADQKKAFEIVRRGNLFVISMNNVELASVTDNSPLNGGRIGLYTYNSAIAIDNISLIQHEENTTPATPNNSQNSSNNSVASLKQSQKTSISAPSTGYKDDSGLLLISYGAAFGGFLSVIASFLVLKKR